VTKLNNTKRSIARIRVRTILNLKIRPEAIDFFDDMGNVILNAHQFAVH
jgi:hypothetical protein